MSVEVIVYVSVPVLRVDDNATFQTGHRTQPVLIRVDKSFSVSHRHWLADAAIESQRVFGSCCPTRLLERFLHYLTVQVARCLTW